MSRKLKVAIDCRISDPRQGTGTAFLALTKALSDSGISDQEYTFIVRERVRDWISPYVFGPCKLQSIPDSDPSRLKQALRRLMPLRQLSKPFRYVKAKLLRQAGMIPTTDGLIEAQHFDVVHFPTQVAYQTNVPSIYQPWDLQHLHYPEFFSKIEFTRREREYRAFCKQATYVCAQAEWTKKDIVKQFGMAEEKVVVIPWTSVFDAYVSPSNEQVRETVAKYQLPEKFFFYPAVTWPHKNHEVILQALSLLKNDHGIDQHVFFTGSSTDHRKQLDQLAMKLGIAEQLHYLGFVTPEELQSIFKSATAMVFPSKFEGFGLPVLEAFYAGLPVISSNATTLPEVAKDAALYFDPDSPIELSARMRDILEKPSLRNDLRKRGAEILSQYSIKDMVVSFQMLYERTASQSRHSAGCPSASEGLGQKG